MLVLQSFTKRLKSKGGTLTELFFACSNLYTIHIETDNGSNKLRALAILYFEHKKREVTSLFVSSQLKI